MSKVNSQLRKHSRSISFKTATFIVIALHVAAFVGLTQWSSWKASLAKKSWEARKQTLLSKDNISANEWPSVPNDKFKKITKPNSKLQSIPTEGTKTTSKPDNSAPENSFRPSPSLPPIKKNYQASQNSRERKKESLEALAAFLLHYKNKQQAESSIKTTNNIKAKDILSDRKPIAKDTTKKINKLTTTALGSSEPRRSSPEIISQRVIKKVYENGKLNSEKSYEQFSSNQLIINMDNIDTFIRNNGSARDKITLVPVY